MASLLIGNVDDSASDDEIRELLSRYGFPPCDSIEHMEGSGSRPAVLLRYGGAPAEACGHEPEWARRRSIAAA